MIQSLRASRWSRHLGAGVIALVAFTIAVAAYRFYKEYATFHAVASAVHKVRANVIEPSGLTAGEPFTVGLKPEWWHSQWIIVPTTTPARKTVVLRLFLKQSLLKPYIKRIEIGCMQHDPKASEEVKPYGIEERFGGMEVKDIPPPILLGDGRVDLKRWFPGSFDARDDPGPHGERAEGRGPDSLELFEGQPGGMIEARP